MQRRLAVIVHADIVGYSRLMEGNETATLRRLKTVRRELWDPTIAAHGGRIVGTAGDALLMEFTSTVAAVTCALDLQRGMAARNQHLAEDRRMRLRIGINMGEVLVDEDDDLFGDGVNIAARLQALAEPGGIVVSAKIHDEVEGRVPCRFADGGERKVKNIARPLRVFHVLLEADMPVTAPAQPARAAAEAARGPAGWVLSGRDPEGERHRLAVTAEDLRAAPEGFPIGRLARPGGLSLAHPSLSRLHVRLHLTADGLAVEDAGSTNGTRVDGRRLEPGERAALAIGARLELGTVRLIVGELAVRRRP